MTRQATLVSIGGMPATGKTTIARAVVEALRAAYVRIDTIEMAISRAQGAHLAANDWELPAGYALGYAMAADQVRVGTDVVVESVNALQITRDAWRAASLDEGGLVLEVEVVCSDEEEHRRRVDERESDVEGLEKPSWQQIVDREYEPWSRDRLVVDTARLSPDDAAERILSAIRSREDVSQGSEPREP